MTTAEIVPTETAELFPCPAGKSAWRQWCEDLGMRTAGRFGAGLRGLAGSRNGGQLGIVTYHRVAEHVAGLARPLHNVTPRTFERQLAGLLRRGFQPWPLSRVLDCRDQQQPIPDHTFVVTFDDGYETVYTNAWPILRRLNIPATVFLNTAYVDSDLPYPFDAWGMKYEGFAPVESYRPMTIEQCEAMLADGLIELGAHTHTHQDFRERPDEFFADLETNVELLRLWFGIKQPTFAFPYGTRHAGFASQSLVQAAQTAGVRCGLTTEAVSVCLADDPFAWGRYNAFPWDTGATLAAKLGGWYSWAPQLRQRLAGVQQAEEPRR